MSLPQKFIEIYTQLLGDEASDFFASFNEPPVSGFRVNPLKKNVSTFSQPIPDMPWSYYGKINGKSIEHVTGVVYSQEPAAQVVAQIAAPKKGMRVLDLAAAPGGKSTHLLSYLSHTGVLVANEISTKRSKVLVENMERFGARNAIVTNESAQRLSKIFPAYFDMIVLDAPCSGEGMFRKDPNAMQYWDEGYPARCAELQKELLSYAVTMLRTGGELIYSTCTWSIEENEAIVDWLLAEYDLELVTIPKINGMVEGIGHPEVARMYPHHFQGEGQFVAKFRYTGEAPARPVKSNKSNLTREQEKLWREFVQQYISCDLTGTLQVFGDYLYLLPDDLPSLQQLKIARNGLHLGVFKKKRFEPSFALGIALTTDEVAQHVTLSEEEFQKYTAGETISLSEPLTTGWYQVVVAGNGLGFAKVTGQTLKNYFPKGLRFL